jgi:demethylmenaquinone methyltransferase/2-methoxy-6-polyprenyl-1,4-benzoquinol methylase
MARRTSTEPAPGPAAAAAAAASVLPSREEKTARVRAMFDTIAPRYDLVNRLMTFGLDQRWRRVTVEALALPEGARILDLACGTGDLSRAAARRSCTVVGTDLSAGMLKANRAGVPLVESDGSQLPFADGAFDGLVCGYALRNFTDLSATLRESARVLRPGGRLGVLEVDAPASGVWRFGFDLWFNKAVPVLGGLISDRTAYRYLPASVAYLPPSPVLRKMLLDAGFSAVGIRPLAGGLSQLILATRVGSSAPTR